MTHGCAACAAFGSLIRYLHTAAYGYYASLTGTTAPGPQSVGITVSHLAEAAQSRVTCAHVQVSYLDQRDGALAVAAAELVASINGLPVEESPYNETACQWIARVHPSSDPSLVDLRARRFPV